MSSIAITELNGSPVLLTPTRSLTIRCPRELHTSAYTKAFEIDWMENGWPLSPTSWVAPSTSATEMPNDAGSASARRGM